MAIQTTDIFLIEQSGVSYKVQAQYLGAATGILLVERGGVTYKVNVSDCSAKVQDGDLFLVNRNDVTYKVAGSDVLGLFGPAGASDILTNADNTTSYKYADHATGFTVYNQRRLDNAFNSTVSPPDTSSYALSITPFTLNLNLSVQSGDQIVFWPRLGTESGNNGARFRFLINEGQSDEISLYTLARTDSYFLTSPMSYSFTSSMVVSTVKITVDMNIYTYVGLNGITLNGVRVANYNDSTLTFDSDKNLSTFTSGDALKMVDVDGNDAAYVPVTSAISNANSPVSTANITTGGTVTPTPTQFSGSPNNIIGPTPNNCTFWNNTNCLVTPNNSVAAGSVAGFQWIGSETDDIYLSQITAINGTTLATPITLRQVKQDPDSGAQMGLFYFPSSFGTITNFNLLIRGNQTRIKVRGFTIDSMQHFTIDSLLTFNSPNPDLKFFKPGDGVGTDLGIKTINTPMYSFTIDGGNVAIETDQLQGAFNGTIDAIGWCKVGSGFTNKELKLTLSYPEYLDTSKDLWFYPSMLSGTVTVMFNNGTEQTMSSAGNTPAPGSSQYPGWQKINAGNIPSGATAVTGWRYNTYDDGDPAGPYVYMGAFANGNSPFGPNPYTLINEVTLIDHSANTMYVSGGSWSAGNTVPGPAKFGQGDYVSHTGSVMTVTNSNWEWVDNTNRLGQKFYAKKV